MGVRNRSLDGLRGLAALTVLAFHCYVPGFQGGFIGVDVFFVLSGFLITCILRAGISMPAFYIGRARRLFPALLALLAAYGVVAPIIWPESVAFEIFRSASYLSDYILPPKVWPLGHTWTLSVEAQFYLLWPFIVSRLPSRKAPFVLGLAWISLSVWRVIVFGLWGYNIAYTHADSHCTGLVLGALLTYVPEQPKWLMWPGLLCLALLVCFLPHLSPLAIGPGIPAAEIAAALVVMGIRGRESRLLGNRVLSGLGLVSYGIYLWHRPIAYWLTYDRPVPWPEAVLIVAALAISLATISYFTVEAPFRKSRAAQLERSAVTASN